MNRWVNDEIKLYKEAKVKLMTCDYDTVQKNIMLKFDTANNTMTEFLLNGLGGIRSTLEGNFETGFRYYYRQELVLGRENIAYQTADSHSFFYGDGAYVRYFLSKYSLTEILQYTKDILQKFVMGWIEKPVLTHKAKAELGLGYHNIRNYDELTEQQKENLSNIMYGRYIKLYGEYQDILIMVIEAKDKGLIL